MTKAPHSSVSPAVIRVVLACIATAATASAQLVSGDWGYTTALEGRPPITVVTITNYVGSPGLATVPATIGTNPVRNIGTGGANAIDPTSRLTGIILPDSVTTIRQNAFYKSTNLASVTFGTGIQTIGVLAFGESGLTDIAVPSTVTSLGTYAFYKLPRLTNIAFGAGITNIGLATVAECPNLRNVTLPAGLKTIGDFAFANAASLTNMTIPAGLTTIGRSAFGGCRSLPAVTIPDSVLAIGQEAFKECAAMTNLVLGAGLTNTLNGTFAYCDGLVSVTIPPGVTNIAGGLFNDCASLQSIVLGSGVKSIGDVALGYCPALRSVLFKGNAPILSGATGQVFESSTNVTVLILPGTTGWGSTFAGRPTMFFVPQSALASVSGNTFNFAWTGTGSIPMNVQRRGSLSDGNWSAIATNIASGFFSDTNAPVDGSFYRAVLP